MTPDGARTSHEPEGARTTRSAEPPIGADSAPFWEATREGRLLVQWCTACDQGIFYPRSFCPHCGATRSALEWRSASGRATVYARTIEQKPTATGATFSHGEPYVVALVDLEEGVRMMTNVIGCPPDDVTIGLAVTVTWKPLSDGRQLPLFTPTTPTTPTTRTTRTTPTTATRSSSRSSSSGPGPGPAPNVS